MSLTKDSLNAILDAYSPGERVFTVTLPGGEDLTFRTLPTYRDYREFTERFQLWWKVFSKTEAANGLEMGDGVAVFTVSELSVEPKIDQSSAVRLLRAPAVMMTLINAIDRANQFAQQEEEVEYVITEKNDLSATDGGGLSSPSRETLTTDTPTSSEATTDDGS